MSFYVYIVQCRDETLYTGWTVDLEARIATHNRGEGAKYTRGRYPVVLQYYEELPTREEAMRREWAIKQLSRAEKISLITRGKES